MMKAIKHIILGVVLGTVPVGTSFAQNIEQIYMKSGSVVEGYIAEQKPGKYITVQATKATIVVNSDSLRNRIVERLPLESLSEVWREWALANNKYVEDNGVKQLELSTLKFQNTVYNNVYLLEKGSIIKFIDLTPNQYKFVWGDMFRTEKNRRPKDLFSGLKEILVLDDDSTVVGQIIEQYPGKDLKIVTEDGEVLSYKFSQVKQIRTEKFNEKMDLWSQIQLLDKITLKDSGTELVGFISSRTLGKEMVFESGDGNIMTIQQNQVVSYAKIPNEMYIAAYDKVLNDGEVLLNGTPAYFVALQPQGQYLMLGETVSAQLLVGENVCVEAKLDNPNVPVTLVKAHTVNMTFANGKKKEQRPWPVITYQDLVQSHVAISRETTPLGNVKITFVVGEVGDYVLYIQGRNEYIVINVIEKHNNIVL